MRKEDEQYRFRLECECGHCSLVAQHYPETITIAEDNVIYIHYEMCVEYAEKGLWETLKKRFMIAWYALTGRPYIFFDIGVRQHQLKDFRDFIDKLIYMVYMEV